MDFLTVEIFRVIVILRSISVDYVTSQTTFSGMVLGCSFSIFRLRSFSFYVNMYPRTNFEQTRVLKLLMDIHLCPNYVVVKTL